MTLPSYAMNKASFAEMYERWLVEPLFLPWVDTLLGRARLARGDRVLDLACGTGIVARIAKERLGDDGRVVGVDLSSQMLDVARALAPSVEWREGSAGALPLDWTDAFDVVFCQQGLQFFPDQPAALREMRRVLAPGGRVTVAIWAPLEEGSCFRALQRVAERRLGPVADMRHDFGDAADLEGLLTDAGFEDVRVETLSRTARFADPLMLVRLNTMALVGMSARSGTMTDEERQQLVAAIATESAEVLPPFADGPGIAFAIATNVATARA